MIIFLLQLILKEYIIILKVYSILITLKVYNGVQMDDEEEKI